MLSSEKTTASRPSSTLPLIMCTRGTPALHAAVACCALDNMSSVAAGVICVRTSPTPRRVLAGGLTAMNQSSVGRDEYQFYSPQFLRNRGRHASEFTRYVLPSLSKPSGGMTGTTSFASSHWSSSTSTRSTLPVKRWSTP